jgi:predicted nucleic acid-binding protein
VAHGVPIIGSLGVVLRSKKNRHVDRARPLIEDLIGAGMFMDDEFIDRVLDSVGE